MPILIFLIILFLVKELWWLITGIAIVVIIAYYANLIYKAIISNQVEKQENYEPKMGEVYKVCPYCNSKVKVTATCCPVCKHALN